MQEVVNMFILLGRNNRQRIYLLVFLGILFMPLMVHAIMLDFMQKKAEESSSSPIKSIVVVTKVKVLSETEYGTSKEVQLRVEKSFGDKSAHEFSAHCSSLDHTWQGPIESGGDIYFSPQEGDRVFVTVDKYSDITSYTRLSPELEEELQKNGLKNISFIMGHVEIKNDQDIHPLPQKNDAYRKEKLAKGRAQWQKGELESALLTLEEAVKSDPSNKQKLKVLKSMQLQKKKIDGLLRRASGFIDKSDYQDAKKILKKASYISESYPEYKKVLQQLVDAKQKAEEKNESTDFGVF